MMLVPVMPSRSLAAGDCSEGTVDLRLAGGGQARFSIELADDAAERSRGLMFRETMPRSAGMLFVYERPQRAVFWMKNTVLALDMIFADAAGVVKTVHSNAIPYDETPIDGGEGIVAVLEINGGLAERMGITPGAVLRHPALNQTTAAWPCAQ
tara:strand:- start:8400 stop:8858 length:459 start_codon:yes stop_codon:yes gene_type:complete